MSLNTPLGGDWNDPSRRQSDDDLNKQLEAEAKANREAAAGVFAWSELDAGRKNFDGTKSAGPPGEGVHFTRWFMFSKTASSAEGYSFRDAEWTRGSGPHLEYSDCHFEGADLTGTDFTGATFHDCTFDERTRFDQCGLQQARFTGTSAETAKLASFKDAEFGDFVFVKGRDGKNTIGLDTVPDGAKLIDDEPPRPKFGADLYGSR